MHGSGTLDYLDHLILPNLAVPRHFMTCGRVDGPVGRWAALMTHVFFTSFQSTISALWLVISARTFLSRVWGLSLSLFPLSNKLITKAQ